MSKENRPNLNCAGMAAEIVAALDTHLRGDAKQYEAQILDFLRDDMVEYVEHLNRSVDIITQAFKIIDENIQKVQPS